MSKFPCVVPVGDSALEVRFGEKINLAVNQQVHAFDKHIREDKLEGVIETLPSYCSVLVIYDSLLLGYSDILEWVQWKLEGEQREYVIEPRQVEVPVVYGGESGPDLEFVAEYHSMSPDEVIRRHSCVEYVVYMMGFTPGFPYLGGLDTSIATPRLPEPRVSVPAGSVGIAGNQAGIYPIESPGGWRIIGRTHLCLFDEGRDPHFLFNPGDMVRFTPARNG